MVEPISAIPHRATNSDTYKGYHIPADATVVGNSWCVVMFRPDSELTFYGRQSGRFYTIQRFIRTQRTSILSASNEKIYQTPSIMLLVGTEDGESQLK
ncbi:hypothetical protein J3R83DRAFT_9625 [Lanmaoa asiatica]|nr:hypothetical protein J3R83DRAFT_9625 [Lanmaoa asiatica]